MTMISLSGEEGNDGPPSERRNMDIYLDKDDQITICNGTISVTITQGTAFPDDEIKIMPGEGTKANHLMTECEHGRGLLIDPAIHKVRATIYQRKG